MLDHLIACCKRGSIESTRDLCTCLKHLKVMFSLIFVTCVCFKLISCLNNRQCCVVFRFHWNRWYLRLRLLLIKTWDSCSNGHVWKVFQVHAIHCDVSGMGGLMELTRRIFFLTVKKRPYLDTVHWAKRRRAGQDLKGRPPRILRYLSVSKARSLPLMSVEPSTAMPSHSRDHFR